MVINEQEKHIIRFKNGSIKEFDELIDAHLREAVLYGANLIGTNLRDANLIDANLERANLSGAYLEGAYLIDASLRMSILKYAKLEGANLKGAYLVEATIDQETFDKFKDMFSEDQINQMIIGGKKEPKKYLYTIISYDIVNNFSHDSILSYLRKTYDLPSLEDKIFGDPDWYGRGSVKMTKEDFKKIPKNWKALLSETFDELEFLPEDEEY